MDTSDETSQLNEAILGFESWCSHHPSGTVEEFAGRSGLPDAVFEELRQHVNREQQFDIVLGSPRVESAVDSGLQSGSMIGPYCLRRVLGQGGMGIVWLAEQRSPVQRTVALKLIHPVVDVAKSVSQFKSECQMLASLQHPNIATIYDAGVTDEGWPFFVMEPIDGQPITRYCDHAGLSCAQRVALILQVASGLQHAHSREVIHRDIKPENILVTEVDGAPVAKIIDFGIAKVIDKTDAVAAGTIAGSPQWMSPEQIARFHDQTAQVDVRTDIFSLGAVLKKLTDPSDDHGGRSWRNASSPMNRRSGRSADELDQIIQKAIAPEPADRFKTMAEFAARLRRCLEPNASPTVRYSRWSGLLSAWPVGLILVAVGLCICVWLRESVPPGLPGSRQTTHAAAASTPARYKPDQVFALLKRKCAGCHGGTNPQSGLDILDYAQLVDESGVVVAGDVDQSPLWHRIRDTASDARMPPETALAESDQTLLRDWIVAGAPPFTEPISTRGRVTLADEYRAVAEDLKQIPALRRPDVRYFSLSHLNNNEQISDTELSLFRAGIAKLLNSLSWKKQIVIPVSLNAEATIFRVNLSELGWDTATAWNLILSHEGVDGGEVRYPYGLVWDEAENDMLRSDAAVIYDSLETRMPIIRADWFVRVAGVGELYCQLLELPDTAAELERKLGVDFRRSFIRNELTRVGCVQSGVSNHNRLVDRVDTTLGAYWRSRDFRSSLGDRNILTHPFGSEAEAPEVQDHIFNEDGGEIIFSLPNGLQAYMLVDGAGSRIHKGPIEVVYDSKSPLRNREVLNAISCIGCHSRGMQPIVDVLRHGHELKASTAREQLLLMVPPQSRIDELLNRDRDRFLRALAVTTEPFLRSEPVEQEPVSALARAYVRDIDLKSVENEIGGGNLEDILDERAVSEFGLRTLLSGGVIPRSAWESPPPDGSVFSVYQQIMQRRSASTKLYLP